MLRTLAAAALLVAAMSVQPSAHPAIKAAPAQPVALAAAQQPADDGIAGPLPVSEIPAIVDEVPAPTPLPAPAPPPPATPTTPKPAATTAPVVCNAAAELCTTPPTSWRVVKSATFPAWRTVPGTPGSAIPVGTIVVSVGYSDQANGRWYRLADGNTYIHASALTPA